MSEVRLTRVTKTYGLVTALDAVSMHLPEGQFTTVLGPSGSGKTTVLSLIAGTADPTSGRIEIGARDVTHLPSAARNCGLVFQSYALFPHMTIFDNIAFPLKLRGVSRAGIRDRVAEALRQVRLPGVEGRKPDQLSGGQQQRVALARAIVFRPEILLLDEPLAALDRNLREEVRLELKAIQRSLGITTVMVTHDQDEAMSLSDQVVLMSGGRVEQVDTPDALYHRPATRFAAGFLGSASFIDGTWDGSAIVTPAGERFPARVPAAAGSPVTGVLRPEEVRPALDGTPCTVTDVDFLGEVVRYALRTPGGQELRLHLSGRHGRMREGDHLSVTWPETAVWILPGHPGSAPKPGGDRATTHTPTTERITT